MTGVWGLKTASLLFQQHQLQGPGEVTGLEAVDIHSAGNGMALIVAAIPYHGMISGFYPVIHQVPNLLTQYVVDHQLHIAHLRQLVFEGGAGVERIGIVLRHVEGRG